MESSAPSTSHSSFDDDPRLALVRQSHAKLRDQMERLNSEHRVGNAGQMSKVFQYIESTYFYESLAHFGFQARLLHFYSSLSVGDRFVAKVISVFERTADVLLIWSPKRDIHDLQIKAFLRLVETKRYSTNGHRFSSSSSKYSHQNRNALLNRNLDVSELIFVELVHFNESNGKMEMVCCKSLLETDDELVEDNHEEDDALLNEDRYRAKSPTSHNFHDYMIHHKDLRNPSLIKHPIFTSLLHHNQVIESYKRKLENKCKENEADVLSVQKEDDDVIILDERNPERPIPSSGNNRNRRDTYSQINHSSKFTSNHSATSKGFDYSNSIYSGSLKRTLSVASDLTINSERNHSTRHSRSTSSSSSDSSSDSSSNGSNGGGGPGSRRKHKRNDKKYKSHYHEKRNKKRSKKHSKKVKRRNQRKQKMIEEEEIDPQMIDDQEVQSGKGLTTKY